MAVWNREASDPLALIAVALFISMLALWGAILGR
jgi:hypothetical protein